MRPHDGGLCLLQRIRVACYCNGDLNFDSPGNNDLSEYLMSLKYKQIVGRATHLDGHILDHVYVSEKNASMVKIHHHYVYYSDHDGILVSVKKEVDP